MNKIFSASLVLSFFVLSIIGCKNKVKDNTNFTKRVKDTTLAIDTAFLDDKNYAYQNIADTRHVKMINRRTKDTSVDNDIYTDSSYSRKYVELTAAQKFRLIGLFIGKTLDVKPKFARDLMSAYFVSKQKKIGDLQPIIVWITGDDYGSLTMIILNKQNQPIDGYNLDGGMQPGPEEIGDSLIKFDLKSYSKLKNREITTVRMEETKHLDSTRTNVAIDSNVFKTVIQTDGSLNTKQTVKQHFVTQGKNITVE
ncbi:hypothetical protein PQ469_13685 [Mucilaginibacter sp. KACC 22773]|uniref:hypothetical protein n=1 Tax=Mucilaginibacter sp. KACC 22773 TaxID=3025671 RepID=UPI0023655A0F|nr:hypothetical protein [Mucilaginibacter sp. KACC 22773]WDF81057.1 hypothetical protein PQ469_13685 [Mucilaginibacter sp. KACC 22773]